jgi:hypothetical protein
MVAVVGGHRLAGAEHAQSGGQMTPLVRLDRPPVGGARLVLVSVLG